MLNLNTKIVLCCVFMLLSVASSAQDQVKKLTFASSIWPPFTDVEDKKSFAIDLVKTALNRGGVWIENQITEFDDVVAGIQEGKYDGSAALWKNDEREEFLLFSEPYLQNQLILVGKRGSDVSAESLAELKGKRIAIVATYAYGDSVNQAEEVVFVEGKNDQENLDRLLQGEADYVLVDALLIQYLLRYQEKEVAKYLALGTNPIVYRSLHLGIRKDIPGASQLIEEFNKQILKMIADGSYNRVLKLNWIRADIDGDGLMELVLEGKNAGMAAPSNSYLLASPGANATPQGPYDRYYINGKFYEGWDKVPNKYKKPYLKDEQLSQSELLKFSF